MATTTDRKVVTIGDSYARPVEGSLSTIVSDLCVIDPRRCPRRFDDIGTRFPDGVFARLRKLVSRPPARGPQVTVIVPVYDGLRHLKRLFSTLLRNTPGDFVRFLVVDDGSPDPEVGSYLAGMGESDARVEILRNGENLGFVKSVNRALRRESGRHCVILNSDTQVPRDWLSRLIGPILEDPEMASVTPFTNSAAIYGVPVSNFANRELVRRFGVNLIDEAVAAAGLPRNAWESYCGVGFCMAMNARALEKIGLFDEEAFGRGYGEEADWCYRATEAGFRHCVAGNLFVAHYHGGSFDSAERERLKKEHARIILDRYPWQRERKQAFLSGNHLKWKEHVSRGLRERFAAVWNGPGKPAKRALIVAESLGNPLLVEKVTRYAGERLAEDWLVDLLTTRLYAACPRLQEEGVMVDTCDTAEGAFEKAVRSAEGRRYDQVARGVSTKLDVRSPAKNPEKSAR